ncbi:MAG: hypothetical protein KA762_17510 [Ferruginibacter sp.]|nr:hypothetical protein [Ferruginibacter sp.]
MSWFESRSGNRYLF